MLSNLGFYDAWLNQGVGHEKIFLKAVKTRLQDISIQDLNSRIADSPKARFYRLFSSFGFKGYLEQITITKFRTALSKLRLSSHKLAVETGRYTRPITPLDNRKCSICNILEDEFHFLFECRIYTDLRKQYLPKSLWKRCNIPNLINLMTNESAKVNIRLSQYIYKAFKLRSEYISLFDQ